MASGLSRQSRWGGGSSGSGEYSLRALLTVIVIVLLVGVTIGYLVRGEASGASSDQAQSVGGGSGGGGNNAVANNPNRQANLVIDPNVRVAQTADRSDEGAVRVATAFVAGLPELALAAPAERADSLNQVLSSRVSPQLRTAIESGLVATRTQILGEGASQRTRPNAGLVTAPASYKVEPLGGSPDNKRVTIWLLNVFVDGTGQRVESTWSTNVFDLAWEDHWRLVATSRKIGPAPQLFNTNAQFSTFQDVVSVFNGFRSYRYAPSPAR